MIIKEQKRIAKQSNLPKITVLTLKEIIDQTVSVPDKKTMQKVLDICALIKKQNGRPILIGGFVRDLVLKKFGQKSEVDFKDIDIEIYDIKPDVLESTLSEDESTTPNLVGKSFGVYKVGANIDIALPRKDSKTGEKHSDFKTKFDPKLSFKIASSRRDFTCNALGLDPFTGEIIDEHGGLKDILEKKLKHVDNKKFSEDPLRVLRAMRFASILGFSIDTKTKTLCQQIDLRFLSASRIGEEWTKMLLKSNQPGLGLKIAKELKILEKLHPEIYNLINLQQPKQYHPEGDVFEHTSQSLDHAKKICNREKLSQADQLILMLSVLCHDFGKVTTTKIEGEKITAYGHASESTSFTKSFLRQINFPLKDIPIILQLIKNHDALVGVQTVTEKFVKKLSDKIKPATIKDLSMVIESDYMGRQPLNQLNALNIEKLLELIKLAKAMDVFYNKLEKLIEGKDLLKLGFKTGPHFKTILNSVYNKQKEGKLKTKEEAISFILKNYKHLMG